MSTSVLTFLITASATIASLAAQPTPEAGFADRVPRYKLQPDDVLEVSYRYTPEYNQTVSVQPDGFISLQVVGDVRVGGLTLDGAKVAVVKKAALTLNEPEVSLVLKEFEKPHFVVGGEVERPGKFELRGRTTAIEAIALAGGLKTGRAKHSQVILFRRTGLDTGETKILNLKRIMDSGQLQEDVTLRTGDLLLIPQNKVSKVERFIKWSSVGVFWNPVPRN